MKMGADDMRMVARSLNEQERQRMVDGFTPQQKETLLAMVNPQLVVQGELTQAKLLRAIYSERQLDEVMTDFWFNHFNVFINKGADRYLTTAYERDVIRKHALGKFQELLMATAEHPAMLFYLDNFQSVGPNSQAGQNGGRGQGKRASRRGFGGMPRRNRAIYNNQGGNNQQNNGNNGQNANAKPKRGLNENYA